MAPQFQIFKIFAVLAFLTTMFILGFTAISKFSGASLSQQKASINSLGSPP